MSGYSYDRTASLVMIEHSYGQWKDAGGRWAIERHRGETETFVARDLKKSWQTDAVSLSEAMDALKARTNGQVSFQLERYSYDRTARGFVDPILRNLMRFVQEATSMKSWVVYAKGIDGPSTEFLLVAKGDGSYSLALHRRGGLVIPPTTDLNKLKAVLNDYQELDWEPVKGRYSYDRSGQDKLPGGLGDKGPPKDVDPKQVAKGIKVEMEHTEDEAVAREITYDHLTEDPKYYDKLETIEKHGGF